MVLYSISSITFTLQINCFRIQFIFSILNSSLAVFLADKFEVIKSFYINRQSPSLRFFLIIEFKLFNLLFFVI